MSGLYPLDPPIAYPFASDELGELTIYVHSLSVDSMGAPTAQAEAWNGRQVHESKVRLGQAEDRIKYAKDIVRKLVRGQGAAPSDDVVAMLAGPLEATLLALNSQLRQVLSELVRQAAGETTETAATYVATSEGLVWHKPKQVFGVTLGYQDVPLTNFTAKIVGDVLEDDGAEQRRQFTVEACLAGRTRQRTIGANTFMRMAWPAELLGAGAIIHPGPMLREHARAAVQHLSGVVPEQLVYTHSGWRQIDGVWVFLHAGGALGAPGPAPDITVALPDTLQRFVLPTPDITRLPDAIRASMRVLKLADPAVVRPLYAGVWRAALGETDYSFHLTGKTGAGKTALAAINQQHYGADMDERRLPASWASTGNALEGQSFAAKDVLLVVDDFTPQGDSYAVQKLHKEAERFLRAVGNKSGRGRMRADGSLKPQRPPRSLPLSSGEDVPRGQSLQSRLLCLEMPSGRTPGGMEWGRLTECQRDATEGRYAEALAGFVQWVAGQYEPLQKRLRTEQLRLRHAATHQAMHKRTPGIVASLAAGWDCFLDYAEAAGALTTAGADREWRETWTALGKAALAQAQHAQDADPARRYVRLLEAALSSGQAHIATPDGGAPETGTEAWGWRIGGESYTPLGARIGWRDDDGVYLEPDAAYTVAQQLATRSGEPLAVGSKTLHKRLAEQGLLVGTETQYGTLVRRLTIGGERRRVLHLALGVFYPAGTSGQSGQSAPELGFDAVADVEIGQIFPDAESGQPVPPRYRDLTDGPPAAPPPQNPTSGADSAPFDADPSAAPAASDSAESGQGPPTHDCEKSGQPESGQETPSAGAESPRETKENTGESAIGQIGQINSSVERAPTNSSTAAPLRPPPPATYEVVTEPSRVAELLPTLMQASALGLDTETTGLSPRTDRIRLLQLSIDAHAYLFDAFRLGDALQQLAPLFGDAGPLLIGHNLSFDLGMLHAAGLPIPPGPRLADTHLMAQLLGAGVGNIQKDHGLEDVAARMLGYAIDKTLQRSNWGGPLADAQYRYAAQDATVLAPLSDALRAALREADLERVWTIERDCLPAMVWLDATGAPFDSTAWADLGEQAQRDVIAAELVLNTEAGRPTQLDFAGTHTNLMNWSSNHDLWRLLQRRGHDLPPQDDGKAPSLDDEFLIALEDVGEPLAPLVRAYRDAAKRANTSGLEWLRHVAADGRVYANYWQIGSVAGRMSCQAPNLQNVPRATAYRACFRAPEGRALVRADYAQVELRIAAEIAHEPRMLSAYKLGLNLHALTAEKVHGLPAGSVTKDHPAYPLGKMLNLALIFGMGPTTLRARAAGDGVPLTELEARVFREKWMNAYKGIKAWHNRQPPGDQAIATRTLAGRRRLNVWSFTQKVNSPVQGTAADGFKAALGLLWQRRAQCPSARPVLLVHDEVVLECDATEVGTTQAWLRAAVIDGLQPLLPTVPADADVTSGPDWGHCQ